MKLLASGVTLFVLLTSSGHGLGANPIAWGSQSHSFSVIAQAGLTAQDAATMVQAQTGGQILAVKTTRSDGRIVYRVKVLTPDGEVRIFYVDAETGAM